MNRSFRVRDGSWCGFGSGGFQRQIHEKENVSNHEHLQINHKILPSSAQTPNAKRHVPRAMLNDTYILPSPIKPSSIHAKRRRRRRRRRRRDVVWS